VACFASVCCLCCSSYSQRESKERMRFDAVARYVAFFQRQVWSTNCTAFPQSLIFLCCVGVERRVLSPWSRSERRQYGSSSIHAGRCRTGVFDIGIVWMVIFATSHHLQNECEIKCLRAKVRAQSTPKLFHAGLEMWTMSAILNASCL
jgi:hypothetical protein